jgi:hypothetical protein
MERSISAEGVVELLELLFTERGEPPFAPAESTCMQAARPSARGLA